ncbi:hypothetical protein 015DV004_113 [Bacillus phage 015DV004]|nr:hypothetical protein 015DV004_113 [Bacillus phage 015DV004]
MKVYTVEELCGGYERHLVYAGIDEKEAYRLAAKSIVDEMSVEIKVWKNGVELFEEFIDHEYPYSYRDRHLHIC